MRKIATLLCCAALTTFGWVLGTNDDTAVRANDPPVMYNIPVDFQASYLKKVIESLTLELKNNVRVDTVRVTEPKVVKVRVPQRQVIRDTLSVPVVLIITPGVREEYTQGPDSLPAQAKHDSHSCADIEFTNQQDTIGTPI